MQREESVIALLDRKHWQKQSIQMNWNQEHMVHVPSQKSAPMVLSRLLELHTSLRESTQEDSFPLRDSWLFVLQAAASIAVGESEEPWR